MDTPDSSPSARTQVRRIADRARYDQETVHRIIDAAWHCHVAFASTGSVHCIPTACWRENDRLYIHGSNGSRLLKALADGIQACVSITHIDGLVLARSAFHHSMNYRSVVIYGQFERIPEEYKASALERFMQRVGAGREHEVRPPDPTELAATTILYIPTTEAAAKIRVGGPHDDEADLTRPVWSGVLPMRIQQCEPVREADSTIEAPGYVRSWPQPRAAR